MQVFAPALCLFALSVALFAAAAPAHAWQTPPKTAGAADFGPPPVPRSPVVEHPAPSGRKPVVEPVVEPAPAAEPATAPGKDPVAAPVEVPASVPVKVPVAVEIPVAETTATPVEKPGEPAVVVNELAPAPQQPAAPLDPTSTETETPAIESEPVMFNGVQAGISTLEQLQTAWGEPKAKVGDAARSVLTYHVEPFREIEVIVEQNVVKSLVLHLPEPRTAEDLAAKLKLGGLQPLEIVDEQTQEKLGRAYPERGVVLTYLPGQAEANCNHILFEPIDPQLFIQRAVVQLHGPYTQNLVDLKHALQLDPRSGEAYWRQAQIQLAVGRGVAALESARAAVRMEPKNKRFLLTWAECLAEQGQHDKALREVERGWQEGGATPIDRAEMLVFMARLAASGAQCDYRRASERCLEAIKIAEPFAADPQRPLRRRALRVLVAAHLGEAHAIAWGNYKRKNEVVAKWIGQAQQLAAQIRAAGLADSDLDVQLAAAELAAHAGFQTPEYDPAPALQAAEAAVEKLSADEPDLLWQDHLAWRWGVMYRHAMNIEHGRGQVAQCIKYGELARELMEAAAPGRATSVDAREQLGRLYFAQGAVRAIHQHDHEAAIAWYDKAAALLTPLVRDGAVDPTLGDLFVSMGVSYWETEMRQKAIDLTTLGTQVLEQAVEKGIVGRDVLQVPRANLASMHRAVGDPQSAAEVARKSAGQVETLKR